MYTNLSDIDFVTACEKGAEIEIKHPLTKEPLGIFIELVGKDSNTFRDASRSAANARIRRNDQMMRRGTIPDPKTVEETEKENIDILVASTKGWRSVDETGNTVPMVCIGDEKLSFTMPNVRRVYAGWPFIFDQVNEAIARLENFTQNLSSP